MEQDPSGTEFNATGPKHFVAMANTAATTTTTASATMDDPQQQQQQLVVVDLQDELDALNAAITKQGSHVRALKKGDGSAEDIAAAVAALQALKLQATAKLALLQTDQIAFNRKAFDDLVVRKMFVIPSFEIHGGVKGLFDLGPPACALKVRECVCIHGKVHTRALRTRLENAH
jgi:WHEP-TRS domain